MGEDIRPLRKEDVKIRHPIMGAHANIECVDRERVLSAYAWAELKVIDVYAEKQILGILREAFGVLDDKKEGQEE